MGHFASLSSLFLGFVFPVSIKWLYWNIFCATLYQILPERLTGYFILPEINDVACMIFFEMMDNLSRQITSPCEKSLILQQNIFNEWYRKFIYLKINVL